MNFSEGYIVKNPEDIEESFAIEKNYIIVNLSAEKYRKVMSELCRLLPAPLFFILELPCDELKEKELRKSEFDPFHKDIYYLDGVDNDSVEEIINNMMGDILINDGLSTFGFGCLEAAAEIMKGKYNTLTVLAKDLKPFIDVLIWNDIPQVDAVITAQKYFTLNNPGLCQKYVDGKNRDIFTLRDDFLEFGGYLDHTEER